MIRQFASVALFVLLLAPLNTFNGISTVLNARLFPRIRYAAYFDTVGPNGTASAILPGAWGAYSNLANSPYLIQSGAH